MTSYRSAQGRVNSTHRGRRTPEETEVMNAEIRRAYSWNYNDTEIALYAGCSNKTVARWREARGLTANYELLKNPLRSHRAS